MGKNADMLSPAVRAPALSGSKGHTAHQGCRGVGAGKGPLCGWETRFSSGCGGAVTLFPFAFLFPKSSAFCCAVFVVGKTKTVSHCHFGRK